ncbi:MAG: nuclease-related domain-containing protein [Acidimicrobiales bacterium]|jgi:hypothetical protein
MAEATEASGTRVSSVSRWKRFGRDRLYVNASDGRSIGWLDLTTGECVLERPAMLPAFEEAIERWRAAQLIKSAGADTVGTGPRSAGAPPDPDGASILQFATREHETSADESERDGAPIVSMKRRRLHAMPGRYETPPEVTPGGSVAFQPLTVVPPAGEESNDVAASLAGQPVPPTSEPRQQAAPARTWLARLFGLSVAERGWHSGATGDSTLANELSRLGSGWHVLHSVPIGHRGADIDHVVIGPAGVFTVNVKHHPNAKVWVAEDTILVNGYRKFYVRNSRHEAGRASRLLSAACRFPIPATGVVVFVNAGGFTVKAEPRDVQVINRLAFVPWLRSLPRRLSADEIGTIFDAARQSSTWKET